MGLANDLLLHEDMSSLATESKFLQEEACALAREDMSSLLTEYVFALTRENMSSRVASGIIDPNRLLPSRDILKSVLTSIFV